MKEEVDAEGKKTKIMIRISKLEETKNSGKSIG